MGNSIPEARIGRLEKLAAEAAQNDEYDLSRRYIRRARRLAERHRIEFPRRFERFSCDACDVYLRPGENVRVRLQDGHVVMTCDCGSQSRYGY